MRSTIVAAMLLAALLPASSACQAQDMGQYETAADPRDAAFRAFLANLRPRALAAGVSARTLDQVFPTLTFNPRVITLDRGQPGGNPATTTSTPSIPAFAPYQRTHVDADRIGRGRTRYAELRPRLQRIEAQTGVPGPIMMAIYGHETGYGRVVGDFDLLRSLATLAFEGRRRELFTAEFIATLKLLESGIPRSTLKGSWAGATGYPQFLPSMYLRLAVDGDSNGRVDIWNSEPDALASIGNYLSKAGWKPSVPWGVAVRVPADLDRAVLRSKLSSPRCPRVYDRQSRWQTIGEWRRLGVQFVGYPVPADGEQASLIEPDGPGATAYLLTTNYRSILDYNCSNFYALSVGLLADAVQR
ncbi:lytic transglycosylase domain-containing protein [Sphingomonas arantia]|uniref:Lytic transglycosylase domain-containing protein n=1 Tax=Sphingomonas arantia TaxID=1460676 RepID=A0ABW4TXV7_9SPHN